MKKPIQGLRSSLIRKIFVWLMSLISVFLLFQTIPILQKWESGVLDFWYLLRGERKASDEVVLVLIDEQTASEYGGWPLPRRAYADLIKCLNSFGSATIVFDIGFFDRRDSLDALCLSQATQQAGNVIHAFELIVYSDVTESSHSLSNGNKKYAMKGENINELRKLNLFEASEGIFPDNIFLDFFNKAGTVTFVQDKDGHFRRIPIFIDFSGNIYPSLSLRALLEYLDMDCSDIKINNNGWQKNLFFDSKYGNITLPINKNGQALLNFYGDIPQFKHYSFIDVLKSSKMIKEGHVPLLSKETFENKIVIVTLDLSGEEDAQVMPFSANFLGAGFHATMISNALDGTSLKEIPDIMVVGIVLLLFLIFLVTKTVLNIQKTWLIGVTVFTLLFLTNIVLFLLFVLHDVWIQSLQINWMFLAPLFLVFLEDYGGKKVQIQKLHQKIEDLKEALQKHDVLIDEKKLDMNKLDREGKVLQTLIEYHKKIISKTESLLFEIGESAKREIQNLLELIEQSFTQMQKLAEVKAGEIQNVKEVVEILTTEFNRILDEFEIEAEKIFIKNIGAVNSLILKEENGYLKKFKVFGSKGETEFFQPGPKRMAFLYYLAMSKERTKGRVKKGNWIVYKPFGKTISPTKKDFKAGRKHACFIGNLDEFLLAAQKCNYQRFHIRVEEFSDPNNPGKRRKNYQLWKQDILDVVEYEGNFVSQQAAIINSYLKSYNSQLIGPSGGSNPFPLLVEKVEII